MWEDPIVAEVRRVRAAHAAQFNNDLLAIYRDLKAEEQKSGRKFASVPPAVSRQRKSLQSELRRAVSRARFAVMHGGLVGRGGGHGGA